jgi:hypothetical protein
MQYTVRAVLVNGSETSTERRFAVTELAEWTSAVCSDLGVNESQLDPALILDMASAVQRTVAKSAAPPTAYLLGLAVGRGLAVADVAQRVEALTLRWHSIDWSD